MKIKYSVKPAHICELEECLILEERRRQKARCETLKNIPARGIDHDANVVFAKRILGVA